MSKEKQEILRGGKGDEATRMTVTYSKPDPRKTLRSGRTGHSAVFFRCSLFIFGGYNGTFNNDIWRYDTEGIKWSKVAVLQSSSLPPKRRNHSACVHEESIIIFGGEGQAGSPFNDVWIFHFLENTWECLFRNRTEEDDSYPKGRYGHGACMMGNKLVIFGGFSSVYLSDVFMFDLNRRDWDHLHVKHNITPEPRAFPVMQSGNSGDAVIFGGTFGGGDCLDDTWKLNIKSGIWRKIDSGTRQPSARSRCASAIYGNILFLFGGRDSSLERKCDLWVFFMNGERWWRFETPDFDKIPEEREGSSFTVINGSEANVDLLLFGGQSNSRFLSDIVQCNIRGLRDDSPKQKVHKAKVAGENRDEYVERLRRRMVSLENELLDIQQDRKVEQSELFSILSTIAKKKETVVKREGSVPAKLERSSSMQRLRHVTVSSEQQKKRIDALEDLVIRQQEALCKVERVLQREIEARIEGERRMAGIAQRLSKEIEKISRL